jgi:hypothetical protein
MVGSLLRDELEPRYRVELVSLALCRAEDYAEVRAPTNSDQHCEVGIIGGL